MAMPKSPKWVRVVQALDLSVAVGQDKRYKAASAKEELAKRASEISSSGSKDFLKDLDKRAVRAQETVPGTSLTQAALGGDP